jgi:hypothetical protein
VKSVSNRIDSRRGSRCPTEPCKVWAADCVHPLCARHSVRWGLRRVFVHAGTSVVPASHPLLLRATTARRA